MTRYLSILILASLCGCAGVPNFPIDKSVNIYVFGDDNKVELLYEQMSETDVRANIGQELKGILKLPVIP